MTKIIDKNYLQELRSLLKILKCTRYFFGKAEKCIDRFISQNLQLLNLNCFVHINIFQFFTYFWEHLSRRWLYKTQQNFCPNGKIYLTPALWVGKSCQERFFKYLREFLSNFNALYPNSQDNCPPPLPFEN